MNASRLALLAAAACLVACATPPAPVGDSAPAAPEPAARVVAGATEWVHPPLPAEADGRLPMDKALLVHDDGDSFTYGDIDIRVLGIDTPEITHEAHGLMEDQPYGREAAAFTRDLLDGATLLEYLPCGEDPYGRKLSHVFVDGELLSVHVLRAGFAVENISRYGDNGTPEIAAIILSAAQGLPPVPFEDPHDWRRSHRQRQ